jgi:hypothetical protein
MEAEGVYMSWPISNSVVEQRSPGVAALHAGIDG